MTNPASPNQDLETLRDSIDALDAAIILLFGERVRQARKIGVFEAWHHLPSRSVVREAVQAARIRRLASEVDLDPKFALDLLAS